MADELIEQLRAIARYANFPSTIDTLNAAADFIEQHTRIEPEAADRGVSEATDWTAEDEAAHLDLAEAAARHGAAPPVRIEPPAIQSLRSEQEGDQ